MPRGVWILFTVSGSATLGLGRVVRSLALAGSLPRTFRPRFHAVETEARRHLRRFGVSVETSLDRLLRREPAAMVFDRPGPTARELPGLKARWPHVPVLALDYYAHTRPAPDAIVNLFDDGDAPRAHHWRCGIQYAIIRPAFRRLARRYPPKRVRGVVITFGSSDPGGHTLRVIRLLNEHVAQHLVLDIIAGPLFAQQKPLEPLIRRSRHECRIHRAPAEPASLMAKADLAFSGGGTTPLELLRLGVPTFVCPQSVLERRFASFLFERRVLRLLPDSDRRAASLIRAFFGRDASAELARLHRAGRAAVDGMGTRRIVGILADLIGAR